MKTEFSDTRSLLDQARAGDDEAFGEICRIHGTRLLRQAVALCGNITLAEDLAQDTLVEAWKCLRRYNGRCQFFTWLCAILLNRYRNVLRGNRLRPPSTPGGRDQDELEKHTGNLTDHAALPDQAVELREQAVLMPRPARSGRRRPRCGCARRRCRPAWPLRPPGRSALRSRRRARA
ncbi:MAG: RNA polymerase sigma factor, partial [Verrucomicrobiia bacterium]